jgi:hypothetical protein
VIKGKVFVGLVTLMMWSAGTSSVCATTYFNDISEHWAQTAIEGCAKHGIVDGYEGDFFPNAYMTRAELAVVLDRIKKYDLPLHSDFYDVPVDAWYAPYINKLAATGVMRGDGNYMRPLANLTREEAVVLLSRAFNKYGDALFPNYEYHDFSDISEWAVEAVNCMSWFNYVHGDAQNNFNPNAGITRAEVVTIIDNIMGFSSTPPVSGDKIVYVSENYGFQIEFPKEWAGRFKIVDNIGVGIELYNLETSRNGQFASVVWNPSEYFSEGAAYYYPEGATITELGRRIMGGKEYTYFLVSGDIFGMQYDGNDPVQAESYNTMATRLNEVTKTFKFI